MIDRTKRYESSIDFFDLDGDAVMKLSRECAEKVCAEATEKGLSISIVEGGFWDAPKFQSCLDAIWNNTKSDADRAETNQKALRFIEEVSKNLSVDTFIITLD